MPYPLEFDKYVQPLTKNRKAMAVYDIVAANSRAGRTYTYYPAIISGLKERGFFSNDRLEVNDRLCGLVSAGLLEIGWYSEYIDAFVKDRVTALGKDKFWSRALRLTDDKALHAKLELYRKFNDPSYVKQQTLAD